MDMEVECLEAKPLRVKVERELIETVKNMYPESGGLTATGVVDWALRKLIVEAK